MDRGQQTDRLGKNKSGEKSIEEAFFESFPADAPGIDRALRELAKDYGDQVYASFMSAFFQRNIGAKNAKVEALEIFQHHSQLVDTVADDIDFRVSGLDYLTRVSKKMRNPMIIESKDYLKLYEDTVTDPLTGLSNFRYLEKVLPAEIERAQRYIYPLSVLLFDLDRFKQINDQLGHESGNEVLKEVGKIIQAQLRRSDIGFRYGGEEFLVLAPQTDRDGARLLADRIREKIEGTDIYLSDGANPYVTISGGVACFPEGAGSGEELIRTADKALYLAKRRGRNRIEIEYGERRRSPRIDLVVPGRVQYRQEQLQDARIRNLNEHGLLVESKDHVSAGSPLTLELELGQDLISIRGRVTDTRIKKNSGEFLIGVSALQFDSRSRKTFIEFIAAKTAA